MRGEFNETKTNPWITVADVGRGPGARIHSGHEVTDHEVAAIH